MHQRAFLGSGWARGGTSEVVRRAHPASGAQWNVQVVRGKVNGKCLWNACKALSLGLLLMILGAAMATIGYYADHLSIAQEIRGNHTIRIKNESRGFHLNNLSYAGPIVMGVGGFIVVAACVMTFEARDSAAKVVPARLKMSTIGHHSNQNYCGNHPTTNGHGSLRTSSSQTAGFQHQSIIRHASDRRTLTNSFKQFSRGLVLDTNPNIMLKIPQGSINKSPSAPDLVLEINKNQEQNALNKYCMEKQLSRKTFAACALLNPGLLNRHALSVDETAVANYCMSRDSLQGSQGSMAMDLHLEYPVTLKIRDKRRNPLIRQNRVDDEPVTSTTITGSTSQIDGSSRKNSHSCSPRLSSKHIKDFRTGSSHQVHTMHCPLSSSSSSRRRSSNASDTVHRSRKKKQECHHTRGKLERAISSDSRLLESIPRCHHHHTSQNSTEQETNFVSSDTDIQQTHALVHFKQ